MNYRIKNIDYWLQFCPNNEQIKDWKNDEVHYMEGATEREAVNFNVADPTEDPAMEQAAKEDDKLTCKCGFKAKTPAGLKAHQRRCKSIQQ